MKKRIKSLILFTVVILLLSDVALSQTIGPVDERFITIRQNGTSTLEALGDSIWTGPGLNRWIENQGEWFVPVNADSVFNGRGRTFSLSLAQDTVLAGLGFTSSIAGDNVQAALGYYRSTNSGENWTFIPFPLDPQPDLDICVPNSTTYQPGCDIEFVYGGQTYRRIRFTVPEQSPPFEVDFHGDVILSVNWASGLLRSTDGGLNWSRIILPPSTQTTLSPNNTYTWTSRFNQQNINRYDPRSDNNLLGFGLLIDSQQRTWVGTAAGINVSGNALAAPSDSISWRRVGFDQSENGLLGGWIIKIREQEGTGRIWMTNWRSDPQNRDQFGLVYTDDGAQTFQRFLEGERINDFGFFGGVIYATGDNGLFISDDDGDSWRRVNQLQSQNTFIRSGAQYLSTATTNENIWIGTSDGIAYSSDGKNWSIIRVDMPLRGGNVYQPDAPDTDTFAYPNPFSPGLQGTIRIKFENIQPGNIRVRVFDFAMNHIRTIQNENLPAGVYEATWDGLDSRGQRVANGTYIYLVETSGKRLDGKILVIE